MNKGCKVKQLFDLTELGLDFGRQFAYLIMKNLQLIILFGWLPFSIVGQNCTCLEQFDFFEEKIRLNYSGFRDKVTEQTRTDFEAHNAQYRQMAAATTTDTACYKLLSNWKSWFKDGHVQIQNALLWAKPAEIRAAFLHWEKINLDETGAKNYLLQAGRQPIEGIWRSTEGAYTVALTQQPATQRQWAASILQADGVYWMPGQVKFELAPLPDSTRFAVRYFMRDHKLQLDTARLTGDSLVLHTLGIWLRQPLQGEAPPISKTPAPVRYRFALLDSATALLTITTMDVSARSELDKLMKKHKKTLKKTPNLIIDCRDNGGGSDITYRLVSPYLYTGRIRGYHAQIWATRDNAGKYANWQKEKDSPWYLRMYAGMMKRKILRNEGKMLGKRKTYRTRKFKRRAFPKKVAVLINEYCASSCEAFIMMAAQSEKVTLIGENTAGVSDYGNLHTMKFPCGDLAFRYPTTRTRAVDDGKGIDGVGIPPDVRVGPEVKDWVEFARQYLHGKGN